MANWPSIAKPSRGIEEELYLPQIKTEFEANYVQVRRSATRSRRRWPDLGWTAMTETDYQTLEAFFIANQGKTFTFTHPVKGTTHTCVFSADSLKGKVGKYPNTRENVLCPIEEI